MNIMLIGLDRMRATLHLISKIIKLYYVMSDCMMDCDCSPNQILPSFLTSCSC
jgi:hypothetical protein